MMPMVTHVFENSVGAELDVFGGRRLRGSVRQQNHKLLGRQGECGGHKVRIIELLGSGQVLLPRVSTPGTQVATQDSHNS